MRTYFEVDFSDRIAQKEYIKPVNKLFQIRKTDPFNDTIHIQNNNTIWLSLMAIYYFPEKQRTPIL